MPTFSKVMRDRPEPQAFLSSSGEGTRRAWEWGWGQWKIRGQRFSSVNTADNVVYLASYNDCNYNLLQAQNTVFGWACENGSRITLKGSAGLSSLKHCCYRLAYRNDYQFPRIPELEGNSPWPLQSPQHRKPSPACWAGNR